MAGRARQSSLLTRQVGRAGTAATPDGCQARIRGPAVELTPGPSNKVIVMSDLGGYVWFIALGIGLLALAGAMAYGTMRGRRAGGDPNHAWKQAASESGHPEVARPEK